MQIILNLTWAAVLLPLVGVAGSFLAETPRRAAQVGVAFTGLALAVSVVVLIFRLTHAIPTYENTQTFWLLQGTTGSAAEARTFPPEFLLLWGIRVDPTSVTFMAAVLFASLVAQLHGLLSVRGDPGFRRVFWIMGLLSFGLLASISSPNLFQFWLGWGVVGVAVWMLGTHLWQRPEVAAAARRAFVVLRVADVCLLLAMAFIFSKFGLSASQQPSPSGQITNDPFSFSVLADQWRLGHLGAVAGVGGRTLVVLALLFVVAALIRAAVVPFHLWLTGVTDSPVAALSLAALAAPVSAVVLLARVYPVLLEAPHVLTALALIGAASAVGGALLALAQRDLLRLGVFAVASQGGLILAALGMGGFSPALFMLFTGTFLCVTYFLASANLIRAYRSRDLADCGGSWRRLRRTTIALAAWAIGITGLSLNTYSVLSATFRNALPGGGQLSSATRVVVAVAVILTMLFTGVYACRALFAVARGEPRRRRGFDVARLRDVEPRLSLAALAAAAGATAATLVGLPGISSFTVGGRTVPGLTFSHFVFYGTSRQQLALDGAALGLALLIGLVTAGLAWWWVGRAARMAAILPGRAGRMAEALAGRTLSERAAAAAPALAVATGVVLDRTERQLVDPLPEAMGSGMGGVADVVGRIRTSRVGTALAAAMAVVAVLLAVSVLAVTGHFPVSIR